MRVKHASAQEVPATVCGRGHGYSGGASQRQHRPALELWAPEPDCLGSSPVSAAGAGDLTSLCLYFLMYAMGQLICFLGLSGV